LLEQEVCLSGSILDRPVRGGYAGVYSRAIVDGDWVVTEESGRGDEGGVSEAEGEDSGWDCEFRGDGGKSDHCSWVGHDVNRLYGAHM
jgi:hypothetical protein